MAYSPQTPSVVSTANSSTATLASGAVFTGTSVDITQYSSVTVQLFADVASATDGLSIQQSVNGTNWDNIDTYTIPAATGKTFGVQTTGQFLRVVYTNGATAQATFRLQTILHYTSTPTSSVRPQDGRTNDNDMQEGLSYLMGYSGTSWDRLRSLNGAISVSGAQAASPTTASWTSATAANTAATVAVSGYNTVSISLVQGTTITAGAVSFEVSMDNTNWLPIAANRLDVFVASPTYTLVASTNVGFTLSVDAFNFFRVRLSTAITGTGTVGVSFQPQTFPIEPTVTVGQATAGSLNATVVQATAANLNATVTGTVTSNLGTGGTAATSLGKAEDAVHATGDTGVAVWAVRNDAATVNASGTGDYNTVRVDQFGQFTTVPGVSGTDTVTGVTAATTSTTLLAANTSRKGATFYNNSTATLYLQWGATASIASAGFQVAIAPNGYYELPSPVRQAIITGIWSAANGYVNVSESV